MSASRSDRKSAAVDTQRNCSSQGRQEQPFVSFRARFKMIMHSTHHVFEGEPQMARDQSSQESSIHGPQDALTDGFSHRVSVVFKVLNRKTVALEWRTSGLGVQEGNSGAP